MEFGYWVKTHYFDASALVKLVADDPDEEPGREVLRKYYQDHSCRYATSYCISEALSAFKGKFVRGHIDKNEYIKNVHNFIDRVIGANLQIDEISILSPVVYRDAERLIKTYGIDFLDCFQIVTVMHGRFSKLDGQSKSILITGDRALAKAARSEGLRVWECTSEPPPG